MQQPAVSLPVGPLRELAAALSLALSVAACHGMGRFGYALLMPAMRESMGWSFLQASWMNTANAVGYIAGALSGLPLLTVLDVRRVFAFGLLLTVLSVLLTGLLSGFEALLLMRLLAGLGTAWAFSCGATLITQTYADRPALRGTATGLYFGGAGLGMVVTAAMIPALTEHSGPESWRTGWLLLGGCMLAFAAWPIVTVRRAPTSPRVARADPALPGRSTRLGGTRATQLAYFAIAAAHTAYIFFVFAWLRSSASDWRLSALMWAVLGASISGSSFLWKVPLAGWRGSSLLALCCFTVACGASIPLIHLSTLTVLLSAALVGSSLFIAPAAVSVVVRQDLQVEGWARAMMLFTVIFSLGQALGSWLTGWIADRYSLTVALQAGSAGLFVAAAAGALGRIHERPVFRLRAAGKERSAR